MYLLPVYEAIKKHLYSLYSLEGEGCENLYLQSLASCRAVDLVRLYLTIRDYKRSYAFLSEISCRESIIHMLHDETGHLITNLNQVPPSLAFKILASTLVKIGDAEHPDFAPIALKMAQWITENREQCFQSRAGSEDLPELQWSDLPSDLFSLTPGK